MQLWTTVAQEFSFLHYYFCFAGMAYAGDAKKGGAGGKGTWGKEGDEKVAKVDKNDPNYDSDEVRHDFVVVSDFSRRSSSLSCFILRVPFVYVVYCRRRRPRLRRNKRNKVVLKLGNFTNVFFFVD